MPSKRSPRQGLSIDEEDYPSAPGIESRTYRLFGGGIPPIASGSAWPDRVAAAMLLGICPVFMQIAGKLDRSDLLRFLSSDAEEIKALTVRLDGQIEMVVEGKIPEQVRVTGRGLRAEAKMKKDRGIKFLGPFLYSLVLLFPATLDPILSPQKTRERAPVSFPGASGVSPHGSCTRCSTW